MINYKGSLIFIKIRLPFACELENDTRLPELTGIIKACIIKAEDER